MITFDELIAYWLGELPEARAAAIEEQLFTDARLSRRLEAIAQLGAAVDHLVRRGQLQHVLSARDLTVLEDGGVDIRQYSVEPGGTVLCGVDQEDFVAIRLRDVVPPSDLLAADRIERVDVEMQAFPEGAEPVTERYTDVPLDRRSREIVLMFPGDRIRALPKSRVDYRVIGENAEGRHLLGEYHLNHSPGRSTA